MKRFTYAALFPWLSLALAALVCSSSTAYSERQRSLQVESSPSFQGVWQAHGAAEIFANLHSYELEFDRVTWVSPTHFFEREARLSVDGDNVVRMLGDSLGRKFESSMLGRDGSLQEEIRRVGEDGTLLSRELPVDEERVQAFRFSVQICSLLPILRMCAQPETEITFVQRTPDLLDEFKVRSRDGEFTVYADQSHLIRRVDIRRATLQFAGYRMNEREPVNLPHLERVSIGDRLAYEFVFTRIYLMGRAKIGWYIGTSGEVLLRMPRACLSEAHAGCYIGTVRRGPVEDVPSLPRGASRWLLLNAAVRVPTAVAGASNEAFSTRPTDECN